MSREKHQKYVRGFVVLALAVSGVLPGCKIADVKRQDEVNRFQGYLKDQNTKLQPQASKQLSMAECERIAIANSLGLRLQQMALKISDENVNLALTNALPKASANYSYTSRSNDNLMKQGGQTVPVSDQSQQNAGVSGTVPILDWGITYYSYQIAKDQRKQDELLFNRSVQLLIRDVRVAYARAAGAQRQEKLLQQALMAAKEVLRVARSLERAGETVKADTSLVEATVAQAEVELSLVQKRVQETHIELSRLMSLPPGLEFAVDEQLPAFPALPTAEEVKRYEERALAARPELNSQDLQLHISAYDVRRQFAAFFPRVDGIGSFNWTNDSQTVNHNWVSGGIVVSSGLLNGGADLVRYSIAKQQKQIEQARALLLSLGILYDVDMQALTVNENYQVMRASATLETARRAGLDRIISLYKEGLEDEAGAARALADLTTQSTVLDRSQVAYQTSWYELEAIVLPEYSFFTPPATQPSTRPTTAPTAK